jgi:antitoxin HigA-1
MVGNPLLRGLRPTHPGEMLREDIFPALGKSKTELAKLLGVSRQTLYDILNEKQPITASTALRLGKLLGDGGEIWMRMQIAYDLKIAERTLKDQIKKIPTLHAA